MFVDANILQPLIDIFEAVLKFFHGTVGVGWGLSIVLMTFTIRAALIPLTLKQFHSMQEMQRHAPEMKALQQKYKEDKQRQQQELMKFYKENNINPLASCLPLAAQLPVFISLFYMLRKDLRINICPTVQNALAHGVAKPCGAGHGANFLFIHDLTDTARGATLVALIVLYVGTQLVSTLMMQSPTMDQNQRRLLLFLPLVFVVFVINFPAGLLVYWIATNVWTIIQQYIVRKRLGPIVPVTAAGGSDEGGAGGGSGGGLSALLGGSGGANGGGSGLGSLLRGRSSASEPATISSPPSGARTATAPPPPPRKKKKRSGRRR